MQETRERVAANLTKYRPKSRHTSYGRLSGRMAADYEILISGEQIRQYHRGTGPEPDGMCVEAMRALSIYYGVPLEKLSTTVAARWQKRCALVDINAGFASAA